MQYVTNRNQFKYHRSIMYRIDPGDAQINTFYGIDEGSIFNFDKHLLKRELFCKLFEDNQSFISVAESNKFSPREKYFY